MLDAALARLVDDRLDQRPVDDGQHLLRLALVAGSTRVPRPATGNTALRIFIFLRGVLVVRNADVVCLTRAGRVLADSTPRRDIT